MSQLEVVLVGPQDFFFDTVGTAVTAMGHRATRYRTPSEFLAKPDALDDADILYAVGFLPVTRELMARAPRLRAVISPWTGTEGFDEQAASDLGIIVGNAPVPENVDSMAEATIMLMLACLYRLNASQQRFRDDIWLPPEHSAQMFKGKTLGLIGYGGIAKGIVERLSGWGVDFCAHTRHPPTGVSQVHFMELEALLTISDIVSVLTPLTAETRNLLNGRRLTLMKPGSILVCTSRGGILDETALVDLAKQGRFGAIGLDVFSVEPLSNDSPLRDLPNAVLTPHGIGHTREMRERSVQAGVTNVVNVLKGQAPIFVRNPQILPAWYGRWSGR